MIDQDPSSATGASIATSGQNLLNHHVFHQAVQMTRMAMALSDPNLPDCPLVYVNPAFCDMTGYTSDEVIGRNCRFLQGSETDPATVARARNALAAHQVFNEEIYNYRKDGSGFWNALHLSPVFDEAGKLIYYFGSQIDVSDRKEAARRQAQRTESMKALALGVAHEFNNLMTVVVGNVERVANRAADDRQTRYLARANQAARRAGQLATNLLSLAQRQSGGEGIIDLNQVARVLENKLAQAAGPGMSIRLDLDSGEVLARLDAGQLQCVLVNLVHNAADAMIKGGEIAIATRALPAREAEAALNSKAAVEISVNDLGAGMPPEVAQRATELFFTTKATDRSIGLGLFLALEFVDHSGGKLMIETEAGRGTSIRMRFPQATRYSSG